MDLTTNFIIEGISAEEIRKVTGVSISAINSIVRNYKKRGTLEGNYPGRQPAITKEQRKAMIKLVKDRPDITINEREFDRKISQAGLKSPPAY